MPNQQTKNDFLKKLIDVSALKLPLGQYLIWGSGPLAIRGLRPARDIDITVTNDLWNTLIQAHTPEGPKKNKIKVGDIEIWQDLLNLTDRLDKIISDSEIIEGFPFMKLSYTLEWKKFWNSKEVCVQGHLKLAPPMEPGHLLWTGAL